MHQIMARRHLEIASPSGLLMPTDFQAMGFGLPAAIAAKLADPDRPVVLLIGDGGLAMSGMELATAARLGLSIPVIVFDDGKLNQIRLHQESEFGHGFGVTLPHIDYSALATAMGIPYRDDGDDINAALEAAFNAALPTLIRVPVADTISIRRNRVVARAKATLRATPAGRWIARLRHRTRGS
jgi:acetolactate synthase-1/2/3 large subunit